MSGEYEFGENGAVLNKTLAPEEVREAYKQEEKRAQAEIAPEPRSFLWWIGVPRQATFAMMAAVGGALALITALLAKQLLTVYQKLKAHVFNAGNKR